MPLIQKKPPAPAPAPEPQAQAHAGLTRAEVEDMLARRDAAWQQQVKSMTEAFAAALSAAMQSAKPAPPPPPPTRKGSSIKFHYDPKGAITGAEVIPKE